MTFTSQVSKIHVVVYPFGIKQEGKLSFKLAKKKNHYSPECIVFLFFFFFFFGGGVVGQYSL